MLVGNIDQYHLNDLNRKTERYIKRKIRSPVLTKLEYNDLLPELERRPCVLIWETNRNCLNLKKVWKKYLFTTTSVEGPWKVLFAPFFLEQSRSVLPLPGLHVNFTTDLVANFRPGGALTVCDHPLGNNKQFPPDLRGIPRSRVYLGTISTGLIGKLFKTVIFSQQHRYSLMQRVSSYQKAYQECKCISQKPIYLAKMQCLWELVYAIRDLKPTSKFGVLRSKIYRHEAQYRLH